MKFFVTGDTHGDLNRIYDWVNRFNFDNENISIIILGDAGICWRKDKKDIEEKIYFHENNYNFHIWFIDGNHENFDILKSYKPNESGIVDISSHIHYIPRGTGMAIETENGIKTILCCGGADSIDKFRRTPHLSWWSDETITQEDIDKSLEYKKVDYILTHCCPYDIFKEYSVYLITLSNINQMDVEHTSELMLNKLASAVDYDKWFFAHYHIDKQLNDKYRCVLNDFIEL